VKLLYVGLFQAAAALVLLAVYGPRLSRAGKVEI
jgi:hypothetical protein